MNKKDLETRAYQFEIRAEMDEQTGVLTGRPIVYESRTDIGWFDEIIARGALDKTDLRDVRFLVNHDYSRIPLARSRNNNANSTMQLMVDDDGLAIRVNLDVENNADARALYSAVDRGDISGMSFAMVVNGEEWRDLQSDHPTRVITSISSVIEVSAVTFPAYEDTSISARDKQALESAKALLDSRKSTLESELELAKAKNRNLTKGIF